MLNKQIYLKLSQFFQIKSEKNACSFLSSLLYGLIALLREHIMLKVSLTYSILIKHVFVNHIIIDVGKSINLLSEKSVSE